MILKTKEASKYIGVSINTLKTLASEELAEDIMKILTCYSARYYGARGGRKKKIAVVESNAI